MRAPRAKHLRWRSYGPVHAAFLLQNEDLRFHLPLLLFCPPCEMSRPGTALPRRLPGHEDPGAAAPSRCDTSRRVRRATSGDEQGRAVVDRGWRKPASKAPARPVHSSKRPDVSQKKTPPGPVPSLASRWESRSRTPRGRRQWSSPGPRWQRGRTCRARRSSGHKHVAAIHVTSSLCFRKPPCLPRYIMSWRIKDTHITTEA